MDSILLELYRHRFAGVAEEMGVALRRAAFSPNITERLDFSCALFDGAGRMVAQAAHIPVHLGAMPASVQAALRAFSQWQNGDVAILNDPYEGGTHLPDITLVAPVFAPGETVDDEFHYEQADNEQPAAGTKPDFFVAARAHHADVGGMSPGSLPLSTEIYQEGIIIPPLKLVKAGQVNESLLQLILRNVRTPDERAGDLSAQRAALHIGERRLRELMTAHGCAETLSYAAHLLSYSERLAHAALSAWPDGVYRFEDALETDEGPAPIRVAAHIAGDEITFDFAASSPCLFNSLNAVLPITQAACRYAVRCLIGDEAPVNDGFFAPVHIIAPEGSVVNVRPPFAVAGGNVETSQRVVDVVLGALSAALPGRVPAASQGTMNNLTIGGERPDGTTYAYYETVGGGAGAGPHGDGASGIHTHMTNTLNTPIETLETAFPLRVLRYGLRAGSGGTGRHRGGDGLVREYQMLAPVTVTVLSERRAIAPWGLNGGTPGATGCNILMAPDGREEELHAKFTGRLPAGARLRLETPGGGGWGSADATPEASDEQ